MSSFIKVWLWVWACCFVFFAYLQLNDPDPYIWATWYLIAAAGCILRMYVPMPRLGILLFAVVNLIWAYFQWPPVFEGFEQEVPHNINVERAREAGGLILIAMLSLVNVGINPNSPQHK